MVGNVWGLKEVDMTEHLNTIVDNIPFLTTFKGEVVRARAIFFSSLGILNPKIK